uniref:ABC transporter domain-containing protein n=1 Tax=Zooxanthella nutricula TaxID=1333877 RepID=A0A7S2NBT1_9DINO
MVFGRRKEMANRLVHRMEGEESWVDVFAWLSQHGRSMFALSVRDLVRVEKTFLGANKFFCKWHVSARDYLNDSTWITKWLSHGSYVIVLSIAFVKLYQSRSGFGESFTTGDAVLLIQLYKQFHKYLVKLATSYVTMLKGAVSIGRVADLLRLPEQRSLAEKAAKEFEGGEISENTPVDHNHIVLKGVAFRLPEHGLGYMSDFTQADGEPISIPLGKVVYVTGATEGERYAFVALIAKLVLPEQGTVSVPSSVWSILLPFVPVQMPCGTIKEDFEANGCTPEAAENLAKVLGLEPGMAHDRMNPGQAVKEAIVRAMLRDPTILICMAPLQCVSREHKQALFTLMLAWQIGGGGKTLMDLMERELVLDKPLLDQIGEEGVQRRTLILSGEKPPDWIRPDMVHIVDLDRCAKSVGWGPAPPEVGAVAQEEALVIETQAVVRSA